MKIEKPKRAGDTLRRAGRAPERAERAEAPERAERNGAPAPEIPGDAELERRLRECTRAADAAWDRYTDALQDACAALRGQVMKLASAAFGGRYLRGEDEDAAWCASLRPDEYVTGIDCCGLVTTDWGTTHTLDEFSPSDLRGLAAHLAAVARSRARGDRTQNAGQLATDGKR